MTKSYRLKSNILALLGIVLFVLVDQLTKHLAVLYLKGTAGIPLISGVFRLYYLENTGAAFGAFKGMQILLICVSIAAFFLFLFFYQKLPFSKHFRLFRICLSVLAAGALGNMIDRILHHYVIDFFYFELIDFPVFNVADCYVCVSMFVLIILILFYYKEEDYKNDKA